MVHIEDLRLFYNKVSTERLLFDNIVGEGVIVEQTMAVESHDGRRLSTLLDYHLSTMNVVCLLATLVW